MKKTKFDRQTLTMAIRKVLDRTDKELPGLKCHGLEAGQRYPGDLTEVTRKKLIAISPAGETHERIPWPFSPIPNSKKTDAFLRLLRLGAEETDGFLRLLRPGAD